MVFYEWTESYICAVRRDQAPDLKAVETHMCPSLREAPTKKLLRHGSLSSRALWPAWTVGGLQPLLPLVACRTLESMVHLPVRAARPFYPTAFLLAHVRRQYHRWYVGQVLAGLTHSLVLLLTMSDWSHPLHYDLPSGAVISVQVLSIGTTLVLLTMDY